MHKIIDASTRKCQQISSEKTQCSAEAAGCWDFSTPTKLQTKWLCIGHAMWNGVSRNPKIQVFEEVTK